VVKVVVYDIGYKASMTLKAGLFGYGVRQTLGPGQYKLTDTTLNLSFGDFEATKSVGAFISTEGRWGANLTFRF
jgi:hypothetical protein